MSIDHLPGKGEDKEECFVIKTHWMRCILNQSSLYVSPSVLCVRKCKLHPGDECEPFSFWYSLAQSPHHPRVETDCHEARGLNLIRNSLNCTSHPHRHPVQNNVHWASVMWKVHLWKLWSLLILVKKNDRTKRLFMLEIENKRRVSVGSGCAPCIVSGQLSLWDARPGPGGAASSLRDQHPGTETSLDHQPHFLC